MIVHLKVFQIIKVVSTFNEQVSMFQRDRDVYERSCDNEGVILLSLTVQRRKLLALEELRTAFSQLFQSINSESRERSAPTRPFHLSLTEGLSVELVSPKLNSKH